MSTIRTFDVVIARQTVTVALCWAYTGWILVLPKQPSDDSKAPVLEQTTVTTVLSTNSRDDPFPAPSGGPTGPPRFCMKTYTENEGLLPQLVAHGVVRPTGRELSSGLVVQVLLDDVEVSHTCLKHARESVLDAAETREMPGQARLARCSKCKVARYCNAECQKEDWAIHKADCKLWSSDPSEAARLMENARRAEMSSYLESMGVQFVNV